MALSEDQRAMLRLLAQREQGYEDIAALMGLSVEEVRARVAEALHEMEREGAEPPPLPPERPPDEPPGGEEPPTAPAAERAEPEETAPASLAPEPEEPASLAPEPEPQPRKPAPAAPASDRASGADRASPPRRCRPGIPRDPGARAAIVAALAALVAIVVILVVGGGGEDGSGDAGNGAGSSAVGAEGGVEPTEAVLRPVGGSGASGTATFGRIEESLALEVSAEGLEPTGNGQAYTIWLAESPRRMVPLNSVEVDESGEIAAQVPLPVQLLAFIADETFTEIAVTLTNAKRLQASVRKATEDEEEPSYTGQAVLRGEITGPLVGAELPEEGAGAEE